MPLTPRRTTGRKPARTRTSAAASGRSPGSIRSLAAASPRNSMRHAASPTYTLPSLRAMPMTGTLPEPMKGPPARQPSPEIAMRRSHGATRRVRHWQTSRSPATARLSKEISRRCRSEARPPARPGPAPLGPWHPPPAIMGDPLQPIYDGYAILAAWAATTEHAKLGLLVGANTFRNPGVVAKSITTIDHVSAGRAILGIGGAWFEYEHTAHGIEFGASVGERLTWLDESALAMRTLLDGGVVTSPPDGRYDFAELEHHPRPLQAHLPIMIGGGGGKKTLRAVARGADYWNVNAAPDALARKNAILAEHCAAVGRDPASIIRTSNSWIVVRDSKAEAERVWAASMARNQSDLLEGNRHRMFFGPPAYVAAKLLEHVAAGFDSTIVELPTPYDPDTT